MSRSSKRSHHSDIFRRQYAYQNDSRNCDGIIRGLEAIQRWGLSFAGGENEEVAEKFLSRLKRCKISAQISDSDILAFVSSALGEDACFWIRAYNDFELGKISNAFLRGIILVKGEESNAFSL